MRFSISRFVLPALVLSMCSELVNAQAITHWYFGASVAKTSYDLDASDFSRGFSGGEETFQFVGEDQDDTAFQIVYGYQFSRYLAFEGSLFDYGEYDREGSTVFSDVVVVDFLGNTTTVDGTGTVQASIKHRGFAAAALGIWPISQNFSLKGKLGVSFISSDVDVSTTFNVPAFTLGGVDFPATVIVGREEPDDSQVALNLGIEAEYRWNKDWSVTAFFERNLDVEADFVSEDTDLDLVGIKLLYHY
ncbi:outer membrane beta-barrel protein [Sessilibacter sp. MAH4]